LLNQRDILSQPTGVKCLDGVSINYNFTGIWLIESHE